MWVKHKWNKLVESIPVFLRVSLALNIVLIVLIYILFRNYTIYIEKLAEIQESNRIMQRGFDNIINTLHYILEKIN